MTAGGLARAAIAALGVVWLSGCGGSPTRPAPVPTLTVTCPSNTTVQSPNGEPLTVAFEPPRASGGAEPVTTSCSAQPGAQFSVGAATVSCEARDSRGQTATCNFTVTVQPPPRLVGARLLSFGDSLTAGVISPAVSLLIVSPPNSYPFLLQDRLTARYRQQTPLVLNEGVPGELAADGGRRRFRNVLLQNHPDIVLLMEGTNDLLALDRGAADALEGLRAMVSEAKSQSVRIALATVPPQRGGGKREPVARLVPSFNDGIRSLAAAEGVELVDVYDGMKDDLSLIGIDDLHPTERGYDAMATIFFEAIKRAFEERPTISGLRR